MAQPDRPLRADAARNRSRVLDVAYRTFAAEGLSVPIDEIARLVLSMTAKPEALISIVPDRPGHDRRYLLDSSKIRSELGWRPQVSFEEGLQETVDWYSANRAWWEPLKERALVRETEWI